MKVLIFLAGIGTGIFLYKRYSATIDKDLTSVKGDLNATIATGSTDNSTGIPPIPSTLSPTK